jgi:hypothetical protein
MRHLLTAFACFFAMSLSAQTDWPWNPDSDYDNIIGVADLMALLSVFSSEFVLDLPASEPYTLALAYSGQKPLLKCLGYCHSIGGHVARAEEIMVFDSTIVDLFQDEYSEGGALFIWIDPYKTINQLGSTTSYGYGRNHGLQVCLNNNYGNTCCYGCPPQDSWTYNFEANHSSQQCFCAGKILNPNSSSE